MHWIRWFPFKIDLFITVQSLSRAGFGHTFVKMFRADFGPACNIYSQRQTLLPSVTLEAIELNKSIKNN